MGLNSKYIHGDWIILENNIGEVVKLMFQEDFIFAGESNRSYNIADARFPLVSYVGKHKQYFLCLRMIIYYSLAEKNHEIIVKGVEKYN